MGRKNKSRNRNKNKVKDMQDSTVKTMTNDSTISSKTKNNINSQPIQVESNQNNKIMINEQTSKEMMSESNIKNRDKHICKEVRVARGRDYYLNNLCQICKNDANEECKKCLMIFYCSADHRRQHWPTHADLCEAIQVILSRTNKKHIWEKTTEVRNEEEFKKYSYGLMVECEKIVTRPLEQWEMEMFLYPRVCLTCFNWKEEIFYCDVCHHSSYCEGHFNTNHKHFCNSLIDYRNIMYIQLENGYIDVDFPETYRESYLKLERTMKTILKKYIKIKKLDHSKFLQLTEYATSPLTIANLLASFNEMFYNDYTIHIIGPEKHFELDRLEKWETFFLHYFPDIKTINIIFIGPEIDFDSNNVDKYKNRLCNKCDKQNRKINYSFYDKTLYHDYCKLSDKKPHLICAFNPGLYRYTGFRATDTWSDTIRAMFNNGNIPVLITEYTAIEIDKDLNRINDIVNDLEIIQPPSKNQYSSNKPHLNFISYQETPVIFKNNYFTLLKRKI